MDLNCVLNFTEICRCCKRTEPGMTSIFDGNAHPTDHTYPPVKEMLRSIASLNVQENDGLPSLVCTSCLNNIQDAFTFILQLIRIDEELSLILATRKQDDSLPVLSQSIYETHQYISTDYMKKENEDMNHSLKVEDMDEPMLNFYQHDCAVSSYENIDLVVKLEQPEQDATANVDEPDAAVANKEIANVADPLYHASDEEKDILVKEYTCTENENLSVNDDELLMVQKSEEMDDLGVDEQYQMDVEEGNNSTDSSDDTDEVGADEDYQENYEYCNSEDSLDSFRTLRTKRRKTSANLVDAPLLGSKLCAYTNRSMSNLKRHLLTHSNDRSFACSKCSLQFKRKHDMLLHLRTCNGEVSRRAIAVRQVGSNRKKQKPIALTQQEMEDPEKIKELYAEIDLQQNVDNVDIGGTSKSTLLKCNLCAFTNAYMSNLKRHLLTHSNDRSFACSKCSLPFKRKRDMLRHLRRTCNGEVSRRALIRCQLRSNGKKPKQLALTQQELEDPEKMKELYTEIDLQNNVDNVDNVDIEETSKSTILKCNLCAFTNAYMSNLKRHLLTHSDDRSFACLKCSVPYKRKLDMLRHSRTCNGEVSRRALSRCQVRSNGKKPKQLALTQQELEDPEKLKELYAEVDLQQNVDNVDIGGTSKPTILKCNLCTYTTARRFDLKRHLLTHFKDMPFACSKCNLPFQQNDSMLRHWRKCDGKISENALSARNRGNAMKPTKKVVALTLNDLNDELKMKEYSTEIEVQNNDDEAKVQRGKDAGDDVENEETSKLASKRTVLKCTLCAFTNGNGYLSYLRRHLQTHATNRPFKCSNCNALFARKDYLQRHLKICNAGYSEQWKQNGGHVRRKEYTSGHVLSLTPKDLEEPDIIMKYFTEIDLQNNDDNNEDHDVNAQRAASTEPGEIMEKSKRVES